MYKIECISVCVSFMHDILTKNWRNVVRMMVIDELFIFLLFNNKAHQQYSEYSNISAELFLNNKVECALVTRSIQSILKGNLCNCFIRGMFSGKK